MYRIIKCFFFLMLPVMSSFAQKESSPEKSQVENIIKALPEVKALDNIYDSVSNRHQRVKMRVMDPVANSSFYKVEVGYQGSNRFEPHYYFYVNPVTNAILIEDLKAGDRPTLAEWRRRQRIGYPEQMDTTLTIGSDSATFNDSVPETPPKPEAQFIYK